jgi:hypothetical protein
MTEEFKDKIKTVGVSLRKGSSNKKPVVHDADGSVGGHITEHWDDRQDAEVIVKPVNGFSKTQKGDDSR